MTRPIAPRPPKPPGPTGGPSSEMLVPESELGGKVGKFTGPLPKGAPVKPPGVVWADVVPAQARILFDKVFLLCVVLPTLLAVAYYGFTASDIYSSEARFVVRTPQRSQPTSAIGALLQGSGFSRAQDDSFTVHDYITSRDALQMLDKKLDLRVAYADATHDFLSRFPQPWSDNSFESFYKYYQDKVSVTYDTASSITTLRVRSFDADLSLKVSEELLGMGEELVNRINDRGRDDLVKYAAAEVAEAEGKAKAAALALANYRNRRAVFDPERQSALQLQQVTKLQDELIATKLQLAQLRALSPTNPQIPTLERRVKGLEGEMASEMSKVAGGGNSFTDKATEFERLQLERGFADRQVASAMTSLENARNEARRKQIYLERIVQPHRPDEALEPRRARAILATFIVGLVAWAVMSMLLAGVREHKD